ncbi:MAG TPA: ACT domain-containing protein [Fibrella sp.]
MIQAQQHQLSVYQIMGFDRLNFVSDVTNAVPQDEHCRITGLSFESDGIQVNGRLMVQVDDEQHLSQIDYQLRAIRGLVSVRQTN